MNSYNPISESHRLDVIPVRKSVNINDLSPRDYKVATDADSVAYILDEIGINADEHNYRSLLIAHEGNEFSEVWGLHAPEPRNGVPAIRLD